MSQPTGTRAKVAQFHRAFDLPVSEGPATLAFERADLRMSLIEEEFCELLAGYYGPQVARAVARAIDLATSAAEPVKDIVEVADALGDLKYVIDGMALEAGIPLDDVVAEIHRSNMTKLGADGRPVVLDDPPGKVGKGPGYTPPQLKVLLERHNARFAADTSAQ